MPERLLKCLPLAAALLGAPANAQSPAPPAAPDVVVTAPDHDVIETFVRDLADPGRSDQIPVWEQQVCPGVVGLPPAHASVINGHVEQAAQVAGLRHGAAGCPPNILILFSNDAPALAAGLAKRFPNTLARDGRARLNRFVATQAPVR